MGLFHVPTEDHFVVPPRLHLRSWRMYVRVELPKGGNVVQPVVRQLLRRILRISRAAQRDVRLQIVILL